MPNESKVLVRIEEREPGKTELGRAMEPGGVYAIYRRVMTISPGANALTTKGDFVRFPMVEVSPDMEEEVRIQPAMAEQLRAFMDVARRR